MYQMLEKQSMLQDEAPGYFEKAVQQSTNSLPSSFREYFEIHT